MKKKKVKKRLKLNPKGRLVMQMIEAGQKLKKIAGLMSNYAEDECHYKIKSCSQQAFDASSLIDDWVDSFYYEQRTGRDTKRLYSVIIKKGFLPKWRAEQIGIFN